MKKTLFLFILISFTFALNSYNANAYCNHSWEVWYTECEESTTNSHFVKEYRNCIKCGEYDTYSRYEECYFIKYDTNYKSNEDYKTHQVETEYRCDCGNKKYEYETEKCIGIKDNFEYISATEHKQYGYCDFCYHEIKDIHKHNFGWVDKEGYYKFECVKNCMFSPKFNGASLVDFDNLDNITVKNGKTKKVKLYYYKAKYNTIKSAKTNNKNVCSVSYKKGTVTFKGKKKGKAKITIKMKSGAKYIYNVKVK